MKVQKRTPWWWICCVAFSFLEHIFWFQGTTNCAPDQLSRQHEVLPLNPPGQTPPHTTHYGTPADCSSTPNPNLQSAINTSVMFICQCVHTLVNCLWFVKLALLVLIACKTCFDFSQLVSLSYCFWVGKSAISQSSVVSDLIVINCFITAGDLGCYNWWPCQDLTAYVEQRTQSTQVGKLYPCNWT